jgi:tight adherence protein C
MSELALTVCFFLFSAAFVGGAMLSVRWAFANRRPATDLDLPRSSEGNRPFQERLVESLFLLGNIKPAGKNDAVALRERLIAAGFRAPAAVKIFHGAQLAIALASALALGWFGLLQREDPTLAILLAVCGAGFGYLLPDHLLRWKTASRSRDLERALPAALDLLVLSVESGQSLDTAILETSRELRPLYPDLGDELGMVHIELRAGRSRQDVLSELGARAESGEMKKFASVLTDSDRFGTSLAPSLRTHAKYLRSRRRQASQQSARKLGVKLVFPVFFLIMPSVFAITLGPAILQLMEAFQDGLWK